MLHDRVLVVLDAESGERRSNAGIVIPATAKMGKRLAWAEVVATGGNVRSVQIADRVLFDPEERAEIELHGTMYVLLRERDIHAVASERLASSDANGLYPYPSLAGTPASPVALGLTSATKGCAQDAVLEAEDPDGERAGRHAGTVVPAVLGAAAPLRPGHPARGALPRRARDGVLRVGLLLGRGAQVLG